MADFFKTGKIPYEGRKSDNPLAFKFYDAQRQVAGKAMKDHLKFAMSYWHTLTNAGTDMFGVGTMDRSFGGADPMGVAKARLHAGFEFMDKLGIEYFCFHDRDIAPEADTLAETNKRLDVIVEEMSGLMKSSGKKLLWGTANLFNNPRYAHGGGTAPNADVFAFAAAQVKKALEITIALGGTGYTFWGGREGYETLLNTDMGLELDNMARLMRMAVDYARANGFKGDFYIEPKPKEPTKHQYDFDAATTLAFLRKYGLEKDFKLNLEANHATLAGHTFQHELRVARVNGAFGSVDANQGDTLLGWDTDQYPTNIYDAALGMYEIIKAGGFVNGGLNFDAKPRRASFGADDLFIGYIAGMDTFALGLLVADALIADKRLDGFVEQRYASYSSGIGRDIVDGKADLVSLERYALELGDVKSNPSGRQEELEMLLNQIMLNVQ